MNCTSRNSVNVPMSLASIICHDEIFIYLFFLSNYLNNVFPSLISRLIFLSPFTVVIHSCHFSLFIFYQVKFKCKVFLFLNSLLSSLISRIFHVFIFFLSFLVFSFTQVTFRLFIFSSSPMPKFEMCNYLLLLTVRSCCCCMRCSWFC